MWPDGFESEFADHHVPMWEFFWNLKPRTYARPEVHIVFRGGGKSTLLERGAVMAAARGARDYILFLSRTQDQAESHLGNVELALESEALAYYYPALTQKRKTAFGQNRAWRRNRIWTAAGPIFDALSMNSIKGRGALLGKHRFDLFIPDDIDSDEDAPHTVAKLEKILTRRILPARNKKYGSTIFAQNLIWSGSIASRLNDGSAKYLIRRKVYGPTPAIEGLQTEDIYDEELERPRTMITGGVATWEGFNLDDCQNEMDEISESSFRIECQNEVDVHEGGIFSGVTFRHAEWDEEKKRAWVPPPPDTEIEGKFVRMVRSTVWVDPAVSNTKKSDSYGIQADSLGEDGIIYRRYSWEQITSPLDAIVKAIVKAIEIGAGTVGIETDQGGDTWRVVYDQAWEYIIDNKLVPEGSEKPSYRSAKAGSDGAKEHRAAQMLTDYEKFLIVHIVGTHQTLERALRRFGLAKPFDLADAAYWSWKGLRKPKLIDLKVDANL